MKYCPLSVVITNYNKGKYLTQCLNSVVHQSLNNIEIILVDDGSTDHSHHIIRSFKKEYSEIKVIFQSNQGVSKARNAGLNVARGEYVAFLDADDYVNHNSYETLYRLAKKQCAEVAVGDIVCFNGDRLWKLAYMRPLFSSELTRLKEVRDRKEIHLSPSVSNKLFLNSMLVKNNIIFDDALNVGEDLLFTQQCYNNSSKVALTANVVLNYRVISSEFTLSSRNDLEFFDQLLKLQLKLLQLYTSNNNLGNIASIEERQLHYFLKSIKKKSMLMDRQFWPDLLQIGAAYLESLSTKPEVVLTSFEDLLLAEIIRRLQLKDFEKLISLIDIGKIGVTHLIEIDGKYYSELVQHFKEYSELLEAKQLKVLSKVETIGFKDQHLYIGGYAFIEGLATHGVYKELVFVSDKEERTIALVNDLRTDISYLLAGNQLNYNDSGFQTAFINVDDIIGEGQWKVFIRIKQDQMELQAPIEVKLAQQRNSLKPWTNNNFVYLSEFKNNQLIIYKKKIKLYEKCSGIIKQKVKDQRFDLSMIKNRDFHTFTVILLYKLFNKILRKRNYWIIGERKDTAQDNSYHLFKYIRINNPDVKIFYVIDQGAKDYEGISDYGNIINFGSIRHTLYLLVCGVSINSYLEATNFHTSSYKKIIKYYPEWQKNKKVFLQHGVIGVSRVNHSLHKNRTGYSLFVVSSDFEKEHVVKEFGYLRDEVVVTGLARWDNLKDTSTGKEILLMPTWRNWIKSSRELMESRYFKTFISFLTNPVLHQLLEENDLTLTFYPHYQIQKSLPKDLNLHERIQLVVQGEENVQDLLKRHSLLITDFSTVSFDFAYMNKPIIYYQFDYEEFYSRHYNEGPIDHKKELFGKLVYEEDDLIQTILDWSSSKGRFPSINTDKFIKKRNNHTEYIFQTIEKMNS